MKKATAKIKEVVRTKDHTNSFGTTTYHDLVMDNGDKISIGKKKLQQVGWEISYEVIDEQSGEYHKAKSIKPEEVGGTTQGMNQNTSNSYSTPNTGLNVQNLIVAQNSLTNAVKFLESDLTAKPEDVIEYAEKFYAWVMKKG